MDKEIPKINPDAKKKILEIAEKLIASQKKEAEKQTKKKNMKNKK